MSGLTIAYWEKVKATEFIEVEKIIKSWLYQAEKLSEIEFDELTDNQVKRLNTLENYIKIFVGFLKIMEELGESYIRESVETVDILMKYYIENNTLKQENEALIFEIESIQNQNRILIESHYQTLKRIKNNEYFSASGSVIQS